MRFITFSGKCITFAILHFNRTKIEYNVLESFFLKRVINVRIYLFIDWTIYDYLLYQLKLIIYYSKERKRDILSKFNPL